MKKILLLIPSFLISAPSLAEIEYIAKIPYGISIGTWSNATEYSDWVNDGETYSCLYTSPLENTINYGESFTQSGTCSQKQVREKYTYQVSSIDGSKRNEATVTESNVISVPDSRDAIGTLNYVVSTSSDTTVSDSWSSYSGCKVNSGNTYNVYNTTEYNYTASMASKVDEAHAKDSNVYSIYRLCTFVYPEMTTITNEMADGTTTSTTTTTGSSSIYKIDKFSEVNIKNGLYTSLNTSFVSYDYSGGRYMATVDGVTVYSGTSRSAMNAAGYDIGSTVYTKYKSTMELYMRYYKIKKL